MKKGKNLFNFLYLTLIGMALIAANGCGSSGSGGSDPITYNGVTTAAEITVASAPDIAVDAVDVSLSAGAAEGGAGILSKPASSSSGTDNQNALVKIANFIKENGRSGNLSVGASRTVQGDCGGSATFSGSATDTYASGTIVANNYCDSYAGVTMNGKMSFTMSMTLDQYGWIISMSMTMNFSNYTVIETGGNSVTLQGSASMSTDEYDNATMILNLVTRDNSAGITSKVENYTMTIDSSGAQATINGRVYLKDHGYVDIETITPITLDYYTGEPAGGVMKITTDSSSASITVTFAPIGYTAEVDTDGNTAVYEDTKCFLSSGSETSCPL